jgi:hypothetical protein
LGGLSRHRQVTRSNELAAGGGSESFHLCYHRLWDFLQQLHQLAAALEELFHLVEIAAVHIVEIVTGTEDGTLRGEHNATRIARRDNLKNVQELTQVVFR